MKKQILISSLKPYCDIEGLDPASVVERKTFTPVLTVDPEDESTCVASISTQGVDADGDLVYSAGVDVDRYKSNPVVCWSHDYSRPPIGKMTELSVQKDHIEGKIKFADTDMGRECYKLVKGGFLRTCSVGFITRSALKRGTKEFKEFCSATGVVVSEACKRIISKWTLIENSMVCIPSNQDALVHAVSVKSILKDMGLDGKGVESPASTEAAPVIVSAPEDAAATVSLNNLEVSDAVTLLSSSDWGKMTQEYLLAEETQKPYPNEHSARIHEPGKYTKFRRQNGAFGPGIDVIYGITADGKAEIQAIRFDASKFTPQEVHTWLESHKYTAISVHPAAPKALIVEPRAADVVGGGNPPVQGEAVPKDLVPKAVEYKVVRKGPFELSEAEKERLNTELKAELEAVKLGRVL